MDQIASWAQVGGQRRGVTMQGLKVRRSSKVMPARSAAIDSRTMRLTIEDAQREGQRARARVQVPCVVLGLLAQCLTAVTFIFTRGTNAGLAVPCVANIGVMLLLVAVLPSNVRLVRFIAISFIVSTLLFFLMYTILVVLPRLAEAHACRQVDGHTLCWVRVPSAMSFLPPFCYAQFVLYLIGRHLYLRWTSTRALIELIWRQLARVRSPPSPAACLCEAAPCH